jgi:sugar phosphate isomerase/epimerase
MEIAVNTACFIGRQTGYALRPFAWGPARAATVAAFDSPAFADQFEQLVGAIASLGVSAIEVWSAHLVPTAAPATVARARDILANSHLSVAAYAASLRRPGLGATELERTFEIAADLGAPIVVGGLHSAYAPAVYALCQATGVRFGLENHPETDPLDVLAQIDGREDWFGAALDTGWFKTHGVDVGTAISRLQGHIWHVHLKDVRSVGLPHRTCPLGDGVVAIPSVLARLRQAGYQGTLSIEHEPPHHDPLPDLAVSVQRVRGWLAAPEPASRPPQ